MNKFITTLILFIVTEQAIGDHDVVDYKQSYDWASLTLKTNLGGAPILSRAITQINNEHITLALSYPHTGNGGRCIIDPINLIIKVDGYTEHYRNEKIYGNIQFDNQEPKRVEANIFNEANSQFIFINIEDKKIVENMKKSKNLIINYKGFGVLKFSLRGSNQAIERAKTLCMNYAI